MRVTFRILIHAKLQDFLLMLGKVFSRLFIIPIRLYQVTLSPFLGKNCCLGYANNFKDLKLGDKNKGKILTGDIG